MDVFTCPQCHAMPQVAREGAAAIAVVEHRLGCELLAERVRARYAQAPTTLPETPKPVPFGQRADRDRFQRVIVRRSAQRARRDETSAVAG